MSCFYSTKVKIMPQSESRAEAIRLLSAAADRSHRSSVAFSPGFVRSPAAMPDVVPDTPPLARLIQGGRGGGTRLRLYLSPVAISVLLALREFLGGSKVPRYMVRDRRASYDLSHDSWTRGRHELETAGLLTVKRVPQGDDYDYTRLRNSYWLETGPL